MKVYLGSAIYRQVDARFMGAVLALKSEAERQGIELLLGYQVGDALVSRARSRVATMMLNHPSNADVWLSIDGDILFRPQDALELCKRAMTHSVVGGLYMARAQKRVQPTLMLNNNHPVVFQPDEDPQEVQFLATGFMAVHRRVFAKLAEDLPLCDEDSGHPLYPFFMPMVGTCQGSDAPRYLSEDYAFCQRAREAGFPPYVDPAIRLGHVGEYTYTLESFWSLQSQDAFPPVAARLQRVDSGDMEYLRDDD